ncbi:MAG: S41 family peptidase [Defluviitaleaceae bacterium]|nr:S41 family peptidase [Defluviitaleaceae bacterium]
MSKKRPFIEGLIVGLVVMFFINSVVSTVGRRVSGSREFGFEEKASTIIQIIERYYAGDFDMRDLEEGMFTGLVFGLGDRYSVYMSADVYSEFMERIRGGGGGVGMGARVQAHPDGIGLWIIEPFEGAPAYEAGIRGGDIVTHVDGIDISGFDQETAVEMIRGEEGTLVVLTVLRGYETFEVDIIRARFEIPSVTHRVMEDNIGYIFLRGFDRVTLVQFENALNELVAEGVEGLIIDVRNNPGGLLDVVANIADLILPEGIIVYTETRDGSREIFHSRGNYVNLPLVVLVNEHSASASEVLAGAVRDHERGTIVGNQTFGKGSVQRPFELSDNSAIKLTISRYYTPNGISIHGEGITPDYIVSLDERLMFRIQAISLEEDTQLQKAVEVLREKMLK